MIETSMGYKDGYAWEEAHPTPPGANAHAMLLAASEANHALEDPPHYFIDFVAGAMARYSEVNPNWLEAPDVPSGTLDA